jgi:hypothetical protein
LGGVNVGTGGFVHVHVDVHVHVQVSRLITSEILKNR